MNINSRKNNAHKNNVFAFRKGANKPFSLQILAICSSVVIVLIALTIFAPMLLIVVNLKDSEFAKDKNNLSTLSVLQNDTFHNVTLIDGDENNTGKIINTKHLDVQLNKRNSTSQFKNEIGHQMLLLHRQKRYLLFPEGSSFQLVFDEIYPIVDFTNYAIMGVTCAVAWELPSKPPSELIENVKTRLKDGTLGVVRRNDSNTKEEPLTYFDKSVTPNIKDQFYKNTLSNKKKINYFNYFTPPSQPVYYAEGLPAHNKWYSNGNTVRNPEVVGDRRQQYYEKEQHQILPQHIKHRIYPVFGKRRRRRNVDVSFTETFELREHLITRQRLYRKIENLYKTRLLNGTACVLRALCESGQRRLNDLPQSFSMELLGSIFQLPKRQKPYEIYLSTHYYEAHQETGNCKEVYSGCIHGFWQE